MSVFTLSFKELYDLTDRKKSWEDRIKETANDLFNFSFPWYNNNADNSLDMFKIMFVEKHFTDEIGFETLALFKMKMQEVFLQKIPYYSELYKALHIEYEPLINYSVNSVNNGTNNSNTTGNGQTLNSGKDNTETSVKDIDVFNSSENSKSAYTIDSTRDLTTSTTTTDKTKNSGKDTVKMTGSNSDTSTDKTITKNNVGNQKLVSDFPQANFSTKKDYAKSLDRFEENSDNNTDSSRSASGSTTSNSETDYGLVTDRSSSNNGTEKDVSKESHARDDTRTIASNDTKDTTSSTVLTHGHEISTSSVNDTKSATHAESNVNGWNGGSKTDELEKYRKSIRNLNEMLLREFEDLFMCVYEPYDGRTWISPIERRFLS